MRKTYKRGSARESKSIQYQKKEKAKIKLMEEETYQPMIETIANGMLRYLLDSLHYANIKGEERKQATKYILKALGDYTKELI
jgi:uncharacterized protein (DUF2225 family)